MYCFYILVTTSVHLKVAYIINLKSTPTNYNLYTNMVVNGVVCIHDLNIFSSFFIQQQICVQQISLQISVLQIVSSISCTVSITEPWCFENKLCSIMIVHATILFDNVAQCIFVAVFHYDFAKPYKTTSVYVEKQNVYQI